MKKNLDLLPLLGLATLLFLGACEKSVPATDPNLAPLRLAPSKSLPADSIPVVLITDSAIPPPVKPKAPIPQQTAPQNSCPALPIYGDTIVYPQPTSGTDYIINPVNNPGQGKYLSWPVGMVIDSVTGAIDLTASETGMKYVIGFVKSGTTDTCLSSLIVGGAAYADSVYVLSQNQDYAVPYYDANPDLLSVCNTGNGCSFDVTGSAAKMKVIVNKSTGAIDLAKTLNGTSLLSLGGAFGLLPVNGQTITTTIYYRVNDPSNKALQSISVQLVYYDSKSLINIGLLNNVLNKLDNLISGNPISLSTNPRPPLVVIVRHN
ncbi:MAG TPA: hypothetical protein VG052_14460 [Puia sp.]|jgi:hypothetical protein|nr:hypothetical protein [Puia sp.]